MNPFKLLKVKPYAHYTSTTMSLPSIRAAVLGQYNDAPKEVYEALTQFIKPQDLHTEIKASVEFTYKRLEMFRVKHNWLGMKTIYALYPYKKGMDADALWEFFHWAYKFYIQADRLILKARYSWKNGEMVFADRRAFMEYLCWVWEIEPTQYAFYTALHINKSTVRDWINGKIYSKESVVSTALHEAGVDLDKVKFNG